MREKFFFAAATAIIFPFVVQSAHAQDPGCDNAFSYCIQQCGTNAPLGCTGNCYTQKSKCNYNSHPTSTKSPTTPTPRPDNGGGMR
jgi:hypothetical protein